MRNGRSPGFDHDHQSVEIPTRRALSAAPKKPKTKQNRRAITVTRKTCSRCKNEYAPGAFAFDDSSLTGLQSHCRECRREWETTGTLSRARAHIEKKNYAHIWLAKFGTIEAGLEWLWGEAAGACEWCGSGLNEWQASGHCLDRINSLVGYIPGNVKLACWPCNCTKQSMSPETWAEWIEGKVRRYGRGRVPHDALNPKRFKRSEPIDLSSFLICEYRQTRLGI